MGQEFRSVDQLRWSKLAGPTTQDVSNRRLTLQQHTLLGDIIRGPHLKKVTTSSQRWCAAPCHTRNTAAAAQATAVITRADRETFWPPRWRQEKHRALVGSMGHQKGRFPEGEMDESQLIRELWLLLHS